MGAINPEDLPVIMQGENLEILMAEAGEMTLLWSRVGKGADFGPALPDGQCSAPHWGYMIKGRLLMHTQHGDEIYSAGEAFYCAPGHVPVALEDFECVDFAPTAALERMYGAERQSSSE
jgi:hypothetical protein